MARLGCGGNLCVHSGFSPYMVHSLFITHWPGWDTLALDVTLVHFFNCVAATFNYNATGQFGAKQRRIVQCYTVKIEYYTVQKSVV